MLLEVPFIKDDYRFNISQITPNAFQGVRASAEYLYDYENYPILETKLIDFDAYNRRTPVLNVHMTYETGDIEASVLTYHPQLGQHVWGSSFV